MLGQMIHIFEVGENHLCHKLFYTQLLMKKVKSLFILDNISTPQPNCLKNAFTLGQESMLLTECHPQPKIQKKDYAS